MLTVSIMSQSLNPSLLAAVAAAILGAQGSPVWARTAELLLLEDPDVHRQYRLAARELEAVLDDSR